MVPGFTKILGESETIGWYEFASDCISALVPTAQSPLYFPPLHKGGLMVRIRIGACSWVFCSARESGFPLAR